MTRVRLAVGWVAILVAVAGSACSHRPQPGVVRAPAVDQNTVTADELNQRPFNSVYHAVQTLRPNWLSWHGGDAAVQVYVDDIHLGGVEVLNTIRIPGVTVIRHMDGIQATARYGRGHDSGVILVTTRAAGH
jgi:hypothetical protein